MTIRYFAAAIAIALSTLTVASCQSSSPSYNNRPYDGGNYGGGNYGGGSSGY